MPTIRINSNNYSGITCNINFTGCTGNTDVISGVTLPYDYTTSSYEGSYSVYFPEYDRTCLLDIGCILDSDYQALLDYATSQGYSIPSSSGQTLQNQLVLDLKSAGIWSELDLLYIMATDGDGSYALLNWVNPSSFSGITNGTMSFVVNEGYDRTPGSYIETQYIPSTHSNNATLTSTANFVYDFDGVLYAPAKNAYMGTILNNQRDRFNAESTPTVQYAVNECKTLFTIDTTGIGFKMIQRIGNVNSMYVNSPTASETLTGSTGSLNTEQLVIGRDGGASANWSEMTISIFGRGSDLSGMESDLYTAINNYIGSL